MLIYLICWKEWQKKKGQKSLTIGNLSKWYSKKNIHQNLSGICKNVWVWWLYMGWILRWGSLWMVLPSDSAPNFVTPSMGILFPILRRNKESTLWSSFFLGFMCFANGILSSLSFWGNICLSVSAYHMCFFVVGLPHSGCYLPDHSIA